MNIEKALDILKKQGYKFTDKRAKMVELFQKQSRYMTAKEILDYMHVDFPGLSFDTIYRNLSLFEELKIIEGTEWNGERRYRFCCEIDSHHHHLICTQCGRTRTLRVCPMYAFMGKPENFEITGHKFEVYGKCNLCK